MAFAKIRQFITKNADLLSTQLSRLESNIEQALADARASYLLLSSTVVRISPTTPVTAKPYEPGQLLIVDTSSGNVSITIAAPRRDLAGQLLPIVKRGGANTIIVNVAPPKSGAVQGSIEGASSLSLGGIGLHLATCDGQDWWI